VDEENPQISRSGNGDLPAPKPVAPQPAANTDGSTLVYYGDAARVNEGFEIALRLLGFNPPMANGDTPAQSEDGE
jgi:hypothetical protein